MQLIYNFIIFTVAISTVFCQELPLGAICSFDDGDLCGWMNDNNLLPEHTHSDHPNYLTPKKEMGKWVAVAANNESNEWHIVAEFGGKHQFGISAVLKSPLFPPIPYYHSLMDSAYFNTCRVSILLSCFCHAALFVLY